MKRVQSLCMLCESIIPFSNNEARDQLHAYNYVDNVLVVFFLSFTVHAHKQFMQPKVLEQSSVTLQTDIEKHSTHASK